MRQGFKKILLFIFAVTLFTGNICAQQENTRYLLPRTAIDIYVTIEKTVYKPGDFCEYTERFFKTKKANSSKKTEYAITGIRFNAVGVPDTTKMFSVNADAKNNINKVELSDYGVLLSINDEPVAEKEFAAFTPHAARILPDPHDYMTQDILATGNKMKMAELVAEEIYDIRDSRNQITRGQADYMPKDGEQLKLMLKKMDLQEEALLSMFEGTTVKDTTEVVFRCIPEGDIKNHLVFRFSKHYGITDADDLSGEPYYLCVNDLHTVPAKEVDEKTAKRTVIYANLPGKIEISLSNRNKELAKFELYAAQYGILNPLTNELFNKKVITSIVLNPTTGSLESINTKQSDM